MPGHHSEPLRMGFDLLGIGTVEDMEILFELKVLEKDIVEGVLHQEERLVSLQELETLQKAFSGPEKGLVVVQNVALLLEVNFQKLGLDKLVHESHFPLPVAVDAVEIASQMQGDFAHSEVVETEHGEENILELAAKMGHSFRGIFLSFFSKVYVEGKRGVLGTRSLVCGGALGKFADYAHRLHSSQLELFGEI